VRRLNCGVGVGDHRSGLAEAEPELTEEALALTYPEVHLELLFEVGREGLSVPEGSRKTDVLWTASERRLHRVHLGFREAARAAGAIPLGKTREPLNLESSDPVFHGASGVPEHSADLGGRHPLGDEEKSVEPVVVPGLVGPSNLIL
jgi:hypothetical protein